MVGQQMFYRVLKLRYFKLWFENFSNHGLKNVTLVPNLDLNLNTDDLRSKSDLTFTLNSNSNLDTDFHN